VCPDAAPIKVTISLFAPYSGPYLGNFTAYPIQYWNVSEIMNAYQNGKCVVQWAGSAICNLYINPISPIMGNGVVHRSIPIRLVSDLYPQVSYNETINITIVHNITSDESFLLDYYGQIYSRFSSINSSYVYFCGIYNVCSSKIEENLTKASTYLSNAYSEINSSKLYAAYLNETYANQTINLMYPSFEDFVNTSSIIVNNIIKAKYLLANMTSQYYANRQKLENCTFYNGTKYATYINNSIHSLSSYPIINTINGSAAYLSMVENFKANESKLISLCNPSHLLSINFTKGNGFKYMLYLFAGIIIVLIAYTILRLNELREVRKARSTYKASESEQSQIIMPKEEPSEENEEVSEGTTEGYFDKWFSSTVGGDKGTQANQSKGKKGKGNENKQGTSKSSKK
jgi:hypothetical protein